MDTNIAISTHGLTKCYKETTAVHALDLNIPRGAIYGFLGPNGSGKTTTIRMLLGLIRPTSGQATIFGYDIKRERAAIAPLVGAIVEAPAFYSYLSGEQNLVLLGLSSGLNIERQHIRTLLDRVGLLERAGDHVSCYSLGMKQRLGIAATLLTNPQLIFLDEPTNGLDPAGMVEIRWMIRQLGDEGYTIFFSSHMLDLAEHICSHVAIIQRGVILQQGHVHELLSQETLFTLQVAPRDYALALLQQRAEVKVTAVDQGGITLHTQSTSIPGLVRVLVEAGIEIYQVQRQQKTLEQLFLELTRNQITPALQ